MIASKIQRQAGKISLERLKAWGSMLYGCKERTMDEYLEVLRAAGLISIERERDRVRWLDAEPE